MSTETTIIAHPLTREQVRSVDQLAIAQFGLSGLVLMENAGRGVCDYLDAVHISPCRAGILCGKGNNAGDGYVIARHLQLRGWRPELIQLFPPADLNGDAAINWEVAQRAEIPTRCVEPSELGHLESILSHFDVLIDCMLGTGASGDPRTPLAEVITAANRCSAVRVAVDIPSGLDCDTGFVGSPCFHADHTCTFVSTKPGFHTHTAATVLGKVAVIGIGVPAKLLAQFA